MRIWMFMLGGLWAIPAVAAVGPYLVLNETARPLADPTAAAITATLCLRGAAALRAIEIMATSAAQGSDAAVLAQSSVDGAMTLPTKRIDGAKCQVFAIVFPDHVTDAVANAPLTIGTLGFHSSPMAPRPEVTACGVMRDGSRVTIPVAYRRTAPPQPELSGTQPTLTVAPNPSDRGADIRYRVPAWSRVEATVYDLRGRKVREVFTGSQTSGEHALHWDGQGDQGAAVPAGVYFMKLRVGSELRTERIVLVR